MEVESVNDGMYMGCLMGCAARHPVSGRDAEETDPPPGRDAAG